MSATHTIPFAADRSEHGFFHNAVEYIRFLASSSAVARAWASHQAADPRDLKRAGMAQMQDQVLALRY